MTEASKLPVPDVDRLREVGPRWAATSRVPLWRVHTTTGEHATAWDGFRFFGPLPQMRFDPHPDLDPAQHPIGVMYVALDVPTCFAEVFAETRVITRSRRHLSAFTPSRVPRLLDLTGGWPLRAGAAAALNASEDKKRTRAWARAFRFAFPDADGLLYRSSMTNGLAAALFDPPAADVLPQHPTFSRSLADAALDAALVSVAHDIGYQI